MWFLVGGADCLGKAREVRGMEMAGERKGMTGLGWLFPVKPAGKGKRRRRDEEKRQREIRETKERGGNEREKGKKGSPSRWVEQQQLGVFGRGVFRRGQ